MPTHKTYRLRGMPGEASKPTTSEVTITQSRSLRSGIGREAAWLVNCCV
jgi:hypothetical protein